MVNEALKNKVKAYSCATLLLALKPELYSHRTTGGELYFHSPFHSDSTPSLAVNEKKNVFIDHGDPDKRGDVINLAQLILDADYNTAVEALLQTFSTERFQNIKLPEGPVLDPEKSEVKKTAASKFTITKAVPLMVAAAPPDFQTKGLIRYLTEARGITSDVIMYAKLRDYLVKVNYTTHENGKEFYGIGFRNDMGGYELRSSSFKGCAIMKYFTHIKGTHQGVWIFEGFINYLSALQHYKGKINCDVIILHGVEQKQKALKALKQHQKWHYFGDRDQAGHKLLEWLQRHADRETEVIDERDVFKGFIDFNDMLTGTTPAHRHWKYDGPENPRRTSAKYWLWVVWPTIEHTHQGYREKQRTFYSFTDDQDGYEGLKLLANEIKGAKLFRLCTRTETPDNRVDKWTYEEWKINQEIKA